MLQPARHPQALRRRALSLVAALVFALQALLPAAAMAANAVGVTQVEICAPDGARTVALDRHGVPKTEFAGLPCLDCLGASLAVVVPPELTVTAFAYPAARVVHEVRRLRPPAQARAPPRPPGQGPPRLHV